MTTVDWKTLADELGSVRVSTDGSLTESGGDAIARQAVERIVGSDALVDAARTYVLGSESGRELARSVLILLRSYSAMRECYALWRTATAVETRRSAVELLRSIADERAKDWVIELLRDPDEQVQSWAAMLVFRIVEVGRLEVREARVIVDAARIHQNPAVRDWAGRAEQLIRNADPSGIAGPDS